MDEASDVVAGQLPVESRKRYLRHRTPSLNSLPRPNSGPSKHRPSNLGIRGPSGTMKTVRYISSSPIQSNLTNAYVHPSSEADHSEIIAPIPRRHLLQASQSLHWLRLDTSSEGEWLDRGETPVSAASASSVGSAFRNSKTTNRLSSFSALMEHERTAAGASSTLDARALVDDQGNHGAGRRWVRWMHRHNMKDWVVPSAIAASTLVKWCIGLGTYSGA
jgi:alpha-1,3-glucosyltransferase